MILGTKKEKKKNRGKALNENRSLSCEYMGLIRVIQPLRVNSTTWWTSAHRNIID